jgi:ABC-type antimicrobial peptide transport system permease subunit
VKLVLSKALRLAVTGITAGTLLALLLTRLISGLLFGVTATDPWTFATVALLLIAVAVVAGLPPALRAARVDGASALRT